MKSLWWFIFDGHIPLADGPKVAEMARKSGYNMFNFNGKIYRVPDKDKVWNSEPLGITVNDIE